MNATTAPPSLSTTGYVAPPGSPETAGLPRKESIAPDATDALPRCAARLVAVAPLLMREFRAEMRRFAPRDLSVPLFRALILADVRPGASVSDLAGHLGVTLPTASVAVAKLVARGLLMAAEPGRRPSLRLTPEGQHLVEQARLNTTEALAQRLQRLPDDVLPGIAQALDLLEQALSAPPA